MNEGRKTEHWNVRLLFDEKFAIELCRFVQAGAISFAFMNVRMLLLLFLVHECTSYHKIIRTFHQKKLHLVISSSSLIHLI